jgi:hypothetical protein
VYQNIQGPFSQKLVYKFINFQSRITFQFFLNCTIYNFVALSLYFYLKNVATKDQIEAVGQICDYLKLLGGK